MEMRTHHHHHHHHPSKRGSMEVTAHEEEDRLSSLPDDLLHSILRALPLKHAVRTSALSRRWAPQWLRALASSGVLDFTDRDFARGQPPARAAATVRRCLELHAEHGAPLDVFRVALRSPPAAGSSDGAAFGRDDVVGWIASAVARGAREVEVDLIAPTKGGGSAGFVELPGDLFVAAGTSLARLALRGFSLRAAVPAAAPTAGLRSLSLSHADVTDEAVWDVVVSSFRALEHLSLSSCNLLKPVRIASETLRVLEVVRCPAVRELRVTAPALESVAFHNDIFYVNYSDDDELFSLGIDLGSTPALRGAYLSQIGFIVHDVDDGSLADCDGHEYDHADLLSRVEHAPVWTISSDLLWVMWAVENVVDTTDIQELQLLVAYDEDLDFFSRFLQKNPLPLLDRLFVRCPGHVTDASDGDAAAALAGEVVDDSELEIDSDNDSELDSLSFMKLVNFRGTRLELQLLAFVLKRELVLVTAGEEGGAHRGPGDEHLEVIQRQVSAMRKASPQARLTVCRSSQDRSQNPVHTRFYHEE